MALVVGQPQTEVAVPAVLLMAGPVLSLFGTLIHTQPPQQPQDRQLLQLLVDTEFIHGLLLEALRYNRTGAAPLKYANAR